MFRNDGFYSEPRRRWRMQLRCGHTRDRTVNLDTARQAKPRAFRNYHAKHAPDTYNVFHTENSGGAIPGLTVAFDVPNGASDSNATPA